MPLPFTVSSLALIGPAAVALASAVLAVSPAAAGEITTRVVGCAEGSCLLVTGHRASAEAAVSINGRAVNTQGARKWRARVPIETLREWSVPQARTIAVSVMDRGFQRDSEARLPIGLLGHAEDLAFLVISVK
jgi:hypothetical protein